MSWNIALFVKNGFFDRNNSFIWNMARLFDVSFLVLSGVWVYMIRFNANLSQIPEAYFYPIIVAAILSVFIFPQFDLYQSWRGRRWFSHLRAIFLALLSVLLVLTLLFVFLKVSEKFSRLWLINWFALSFALIVGYRFLTYLLLTRIRSSGYNRRNVLVVGAGDLGKLVSQNLLSQRSSGYDIALFLDDNSEIQSKTIDGVDVLTDMEKIEFYVQKFNIREVWIALPLRAEKRLKEIIALLRYSMVSIKLIPDIFGLELMNHSVCKVAGVYALDLRSTPMVGWRQLVKYLEDRIIGLFIFILIIPILILISIGVKLTSPGPVLFKQRRHGWDGDIINVYKFRTMKVHQENSGQVSQATKNDSRITKLGSFLRKTSLDELPQFYNVLQGRMSIVGPRPHAIEHNEMYKSKVDKYMLRHKMKPGITGWAQINGLRGETDTLEKMQKRVEYDLYYIQNWSLWPDLKIIFLTIFKGFVDKNAY